jgi:stage II sporulation protein E
MALMECEAAPVYKISAGYAEAAGVSGEVTGDSVRICTGNDAYAYSLICDGMGSGELARRTSTFACELMSKMLGAGAATGTIIHLLNTLVRSRSRTESEECSTTVDLFEMDLISGEAVFTKCGAAPSYIKRKNSLFRIKSETMPLGLLKSVDAERIRAEVLDGDYIVMTSDGILGSEAEDSPWLIDILNKPYHADSAALAALILDEAKKNNDRHDDMSVAVLKIKKL